MSGKFQKRSRIHTLWGRKGGLRNVKHKWWGGGVVVWTRLLANVEVDDDDDGGEGGRQLISGAEMKV